MADVFTFNGVGNESMGLTVLNQTVEPLGTPVERVFQDIPGMAGSHLMGTRRDRRYFSVPFVIKSADDADAQTKIAAISKWLHTAAAATLTFADRPDRCYSALLDGEVTVNRLTTTKRTGTLMFVCADPRQFATAETSFDIGVGDTILANPGNVAAIPRITLPFTSAATFVGLYANGRAFELGTPPTVDETPFEPRTVLLHDDMSSPWPVGTLGTIGVGAQMGYSSGLASPKVGDGSFGTGSGLHGASIAKAFPLTGGSALAQDFEATITLNLDNRVPSNKDELAAYNAAVKAHGKTSSEALAAKATLDAATLAMKTMTMVYAYGLAEDGSVLFRASLGDMWADTVRNRADFALGNGAVSLLSTTGPTATAYNDFHGYLRVMRSGTSWDVEVARKWNGVVSQRKTAHRVNASYSAPLASICIYIAAYGTMPPTATCNVTQVDVVRLNTQVSTVPPQIALAGDVITIEGYAVRLNDEPYPAVINIGSQLIEAAPGDTLLTVNTDGDLDAPTASIRPAWL